MSETRHQKRSLIYPVAGTKQIIDVEALGGNAFAPDYYPGREVLIYYGGVDGTATTGLESLVVKRVIASVSNGQICLNAPLQYDVIGGDVSEILLL